MIQPLAYARDTATTFKRKREQRNRRESLRKGLTGKIRTLERESVCFPDLPRKIQIIPSELSVCSIVPVCAAFSLSIAKISTISRKKPRELFKSGRMKT